MNDLRWLRIIAGILVLFAGLLVYIGILVNKFVSTGVVGP